VLLDAVRDIKGQFAQALTQRLAEGVAITIPAYLEEAIRWVTESQSGGNGVVGRVPAETHVP
jgi:hypothetical protein